MSNTRRQHHVWKSYLKPWTNNEIIFCLQNSQIFKSNTINVGVERDFYKLPSLTDSDISGLQLLFNRMHPYGKNLFENFLFCFGYPGWLATNPPPYFESDPLWNAELNKILINIEERWHAAIEGRIEPILASLRQRDISFYNEDQKCRIFLHFLCLQSFRTKGMRNRIAAINDPIKGFSTKRCWNILRNVFAVNVAASLYLERKDRPLLILKNDTTLPFITGDQPVINILYNINHDKRAELLSFYYPVTPTTAIIIGECNHRSDYESGLVSMDQVKNLNKKIYNASHQQVFCNSKNALSSLIS